MRRVGLVALTAIIVLAGVVAFLLFFQARDDSDLTRSGAPGQEAPELTSPVLRQGNVVLAYSDRADRPALQALAEDISGPPDPALAEAGQAVILRRSSDVQGVEALAFRRRLRAGGARDPRLRGFVEHFLGRGDGTAGG